MKTFLTSIIAALISFSAAGQICECADRNPNIECDTAFLKSNSLIYYQFDCDSIWLTLENQNSVKHEIFKIATKSIYIPSLLYLKQDCDQSALFSMRHSKDSVEFYLVNKNSGQIIKTFHNVISSGRKESCFVPYYKESATTISVYNIKSKLEVEIATPKEMLDGEFTCTGFDVIDGSIFLYFYKNKQEQHTIEINIRNTLTNQKDGSTPN